MCELVIGCIGLHQNLLHFLLLIPVTSEACYSEVYHSHHNIQPTKKLIIGLQMKLVIVI